MPEQNMVIMQDPIPSRVGREILDPLGAVPEEECRVGLSRARVIRCRTPGGPVCLRGWPIGMPRQRLDFIFGAIQVARRQGIDVVPAYINPTAAGRWIEAGGRFWELTEWMRGAADYPCNPAPERLTAALAEIGSLHRVWKSWQGATEPSPGVARRSRILHQLLSVDLLARWVSPAAALVRRGAAADLQHLADRTARAVRAMGPRLDDALASLLAYPVLTHPVLRDVHADHILWEGNRVSGIVDFGALAVDEPAVDLIRLLASCQPERRGWQAPITAYERASGTVVDLRRLSVLDHASCLLSAAQWAEWLLVDHLQFDAPAERTVGRWRHLVERLENTAWDSPLES